MIQPENSFPILNSPSPEKACDFFLDDLKAWAYACIDRFRDQPPTNNHDQLTYTTGWEPYILKSQDIHVIQFLKSVQESTASSFEAKDLWHHGYWRMQEAHHGTEHFELFLGFMWRVQQGNATTHKQLIDAVEHIGNWSADVPEWFDYSTGLFRSLYFGTDGIRADEIQLNMPDHLRCANLLLLAYDITHDSKYFELAESYSEKWASAICNINNPLPVGITIDGVVQKLSDSGKDTYLSFASMAGNLAYDLYRAENILASGGINLFLKLWQEGRKDIFLKAVKRLLSILSKALTDADAGPVSDAIRQYRRVTGQHDFDHYILKILNTLSPFDAHTIGIALPENQTARPPGVGKRADMPIWYEDASLRRHNPILLSVAAEIQDNQALATRAVDMARTYFALAVKLFPDGRHHGCAARTVSAIARGHGRNNNAGMTSAVLLPTMQNLNII